MHLTCISTFTDTPTPNGAGASVNPEIPTKLNYAHIKIHIQIYSNATITNHIFATYLTPCVPALNKILPV